MAMEKSIELINNRIREGNARVVTAEEMPGIVAELGEEGALAEVDVVTTGTFGAMCSTGAFLNFGHSDPPIRMSQVFLNDVEAYGGVAAVDAYLGATQQSINPGNGVRRGPCPRGLRRREEGRAPGPFPGDGLLPAGVSSPPSSSSTT